MSIRKKAILFFGVIFITLVIIASLALDLIITNQFGSLEQDIAITENQHHKETLELNITSLHPLVDDWSLWDSMYEYVQDPYEEFETSNFGYNTLISLHIHAMYIWDEEGKVIRKDSLDETEESALNENPKYDEIAKKVKPLLILDDEHEYISGYVADEQDVFFIGAHSILTSEGEGPQQGTFMMLRKINIDEPKEDMFLSSIKTPVNLYHLQQEDNLQGFDNILTGLEKEASVSITLSDTEMKTYTKANDIFGEPVLLYESVFTRDIYQKGLQVKGVAEVAIAIISLIIGAFAYFQFDNELLKGIATLTIFMQGVVKNPQTKERLALHTNKEMSILTDTLNNMLDRQTEQQKQLELSNQNLARINKQIADKQQELANNNQEMSELNQAMIGREMKMVELKKEIELLRSKLGQTPLP